VRLRGLKTLRALANRVRARVASRGLILGYHRVAETDWDPFGLCVRPDRFDAQLRVLRARANPIGLERLVRGLSEGELPPCAVALTFDDGYLDNLRAALPLLERHGVPATFFVVSGARGATPWWDELAGLLAPERDVARATELQRRLMREPASVREASLERIRAERPDATGAAAAPRTMTADELRELAASPLADVGSHSVTHPLLAELSEPQRRAEAADSRAALGELLGREIRTFSYPNGSCSPEAARNVREAGYALACASREDVLLSGTDRFRLPRFWAPDLGPREFGRWIGPWLR